MAIFRRNILFTDKSPKAWEITSSWEGPWVTTAEECSPGPAPKCEENAYGNEWWGTNYGLSGRYMRDFVGWTPDRKLEFQSMSVDRCGDIWEKTRWTWMKGNQIQNQEIANLLFDWGVRRWNSLINGVRQALGQGFATATKSMVVTQIVNGKKVKKQIYAGDSLIGDGDKYSVRIKYTDVGGNPENRNAGCFIFTDFAIQQLNRIALLPNFSFHSYLKKIRMDLDKPKHDSIKARYNSFCVQGTPTKMEWERGIKCLKPKFSIKSVGAPLQSNEYGDAVKWVGYGAAVYFGGRVLKWW